MSARNPLAIERAGMAALEDDAAGEGGGTFEDWSRLTFGEQHEYERRGCRTAGVVFKTSVSDREISVTAQMPPNLALTGLTETEAKNYELSLHHQMESALVWIIKRHQQSHSSTALKGQP